MAESTLLVCLLELVVIYMYLGSRDQLMMAESKPLVCLLELVVIYMYNICMT
ncbi:predicted protein [Nematostella vectensis]|uniref:Uncharacterized protein n=1 Tax=Nematostella vectensis TaxID=45351 RepID=A7REN7_NEMVE|nr:predicted protein [Nematostella vectensis]|eukprot:XP_001641889.1 predicted protein [Nematostella vectensis]